MHAWDCDFPVGLSAPQRTHLIQELRMARGLGKEEQWSPGLMCVSACACPPSMASTEDLRPISIGLCVLEPVAYPLCQPAYRING